jgi:Branched-chain amino acid ABC-type transport system, permease components
LPFFYILEKFVLSSKNILYIEIWGVIITFGFSIFLQGTMSYLWSAQSRSYAYLDNVIDFFGVSFLLNKFLTTIVAALLIFLLYFLLFKTNIGIMLRGVIQDPELASNLGLNMRKIFLIAFIISSFIASISGVLLSMSFEINPFMGSIYLILAFVIAVVGGIGNPLGSLISGILFGFVDVIISYTIGPSLKFFIIYSLLLLILIYRPWGLMGRGVRYA